MATYKGLFSSSEDRFASELDTTCEWPASGWRLTSTTLRATREHDELTASIESGSKENSPKEHTAYDPSIYININEYIYIYIYL